MTKVSFGVWPVAGMRTTVEHPVPQQAGLAATVPRVLFLDRQRCWSRWRSDPENLDGPVQQFDQHLMPGQHAGGPVPATARCACRFKHRWTS